MYGVRVKTTGRVSFCACGRKTVALSTTPSRMGTFTAHCMSTSDNDGVASWANAAADASSDRATPILAAGLKRFPAIFPPNLTVETISENTGGCEFVHPPGYAGQCLERINRGRRFRVTSFCDRDGCALAPKPRPFASCSTDFPAACAK